MQDSSGQLNSAARQPWIDMMRGFCMIAILWFHTEMYYAGTDVTPYGFYVENVLAGFFFLSGYLFYRPSGFEPQRKIKSVFSNIFFPYLIFTTLIALPKALAHGEEMNIREIFTEIIIGHASWFVAALIVAELLFTLILWITNGKHPYILPLIIIAVAGSGVIGNMEYHSKYYFAQNYWHFNEALIAVGFIYSGYLCNEYKVLIKRFNTPSSISFLIVLLILLKVYEYKYGLKMVMGPIAVTNYPVFLIDCLIGCLLMMLLFNSSIFQSFNFSILKWTGSHSLVYYFICGGVPLLTAMLLNKAGLEYSAHPYLIILAFLIVYAISTLITWIIYRFLPFMVSLRNWRIFIVSIILFTFSTAKAQTPDNLDNDIPLINVETVNGVMPDRTVIDAPEGCYGVSITDNKYVHGRMIMTLRGKSLYDSEEYLKDVSGMKIKIRGNSTGAYLDQHPYKIKLSVPYDLLRRNDSGYDHREWILLSMFTWNPQLTNQQSNTLNMLGFLIGKIVGIEWTPAYELVHLVINNQYQGMYYLVEAVEKGEKRINISDTGFIIENDVFWWNEPVYFKTDRQSLPFGYTFKYPDDDDVTQDILNEIQNSMNAVEDAVYSNSEVSNYLDLESFAKWMLVHDILGTEDAMGANRYLYKYDDNNSSKIKIGPTWDFDSSFRTDNFSLLRSADWFFYPSLFRNEEFIETYTNLWNKLRPTLINDIRKGMEQVKSTYGEVFDRNMEIHQSIFPGEGQNKFNDQIDELLQKIENRINYITTDIKIIRSYNNSTIYDLNGRRVTAPNKGIYIKNNKKYSY